MPSFPVEGRHFSVVCARSIRFRTDSVVKLFLVFVLVGVCATITSCRRARALGPPRAVPVALDGHLDLRLMTFNIRYETNEDMGSRAWSRRVPGIVRMFREEAPDVIAVQEALHGQAADLWASLPEYEFFGVGRDDGKRIGEYTGIFFRRDRFVPVPGDAGTFWLSDRPDEPGSMTWGNGIPRVVSWLRLTDRSTQRDFYVFNTHWDHRHQGSREKAALLLAKRIDNRKKTDAPVVLMGDFNAIEQNPGLAYLQGKPGALAGATTVPATTFVDTFQVLNPAAKNRRTLHFWTGSREGPVKVDHILVSEGAEIVSANIRHHDDPLISDHFPVTARVVFSQP